MPRNTCGPRVYYLDLIYLLNIAMAYTHIGACAAAIASNVARGVFNSTGRFGPNLVLLALTSLIVAHMAMRNRTRGVLVDRKSIAIVMIRVLLTIGFWHWYFTRAL